MKKLYDRAINISFVKKLMKINIFAKLLDYEFVLYMAFGAVTTVVNLVTFYGLSALFGPEPVVTYSLFGREFIVSWGTQLINFTSWFVTIVVAFVTNKIYVFESRSWGARVLGREFSAFIGVRVLSLGVEHGGLFVLSDLRGLKPFTSKLITAVFVVIINYFFSKFIIFRKKEGTKDAV